MKLSLWNVGLPVLLCAISVIFFSPVSAKTTYITKTCSFTLGDNDTKNEAREVSFLRCKRKVLEKAGSYIQQQIKVTDGRLTKEQVSVYAAAILSVEVVKERFSFKGSSMILEQTVKASIDLEQVRSRLAARATSSSRCPSSRRRCALASRSTRASPSGSRCTRRSCTTCPARRWRGWRAPRRRAVPHPWTR